MQVGLSSGEVMIHILCWQRSAEFETLLQTDAVSNDLFHNLQKSEINDILSLPEDNTVWRS